MASLRDIRKRIASVKKTQQITRAMRMVAAAKLRRAQEAILAARPYADRMNATLAEVARRQRGASHPLLAVRRPVRRLEIILLTSDRGLCGSLNAAAIKRTEALIVERERGLEALRLTLVGRKGRDFFRRHRPERIREERPQAIPVEYARAAELAAGIAERYEAEEMDEAVLVYSEFRSALSQHAAVQRLVPVIPEPVAAEAEPYTVEPDEDTLLRRLVPKALEVAVYRALLENEASEHAARMTAMESATRNTEEMIDRLTLQFNRARQAAITTELVEIITGAEAL